MPKRNSLNKNKYGYFDVEWREYVITRPDTPAPWINYLGQGHYGGIISNTAGGFSFDRNPRDRRVTRYRYNAIPEDQPGRYIYLRDQASGEYWSPTWQPVPERKLESYVCRHGAGYTRIGSVYKGIAAEILYFVPPTAPGDTCPCELWILRVKNTGRRRRYLRAFSYVEFSFCDTLIDQHNMDWGMHIFRTRQAEGVIYASTQFRPETTFFASNIRPAGFDGWRDVFVGRYRDLSRPAVVEAGRPGNSLAPRGNCIGSLCHNIRLAPGEEKEIIYILGITDDAAAIAPVLERYRQPANVQAAFEALKADWNEYLSHFTVQTPDAELDAMLNFWNPVQCRTTLYWSRFVSAYETGIGRGMGTRDSAQDTLGVAHSVPDLVRAKLSQLWHLQFGDGHVWHEFYPLTGQGGPGHAAAFPNWPQWFSDDHLWLVLATCAYLRETADFAYLEERVPGWDYEGETVWEHMLRAVGYTLNNRGPHGLPRAGFADWDDTLNVDHGSGRAESVWCGMQFCRAMLDLAELSEHLGWSTHAQRFRMLKEEMAAIINRTSWDGAWYARAYDDDGRPIGVQSETQHQINLNPQTWAVIGEVADAERGRLALENANARLATPFGLRLMQPPYTAAEPRVGGTATFLPGAKENGGIFCHAHTWAIIAAARLGWSERAYEYYRQILPLARTDVERAAVEPYVYCQNICGPDHPQYGYGRNSWLTGTAAWAYVAGTQWLLGIRPTFGGLQIAPLMPPDWPGFEAVRIFRGVRYHITVERAGPGNDAALSVDGKMLTGNIVPIPPKDQTDVEVNVIVT